MSDAALGQLLVLSFLFGGVLGVVFLIKVMIPAHIASGKPVRRNGQWIGPEHPDYPKPEAK
jgi:hypothetical protein